MEVLPAIDLREGRCVRLIQGRRQEELFFSDDPVAVAIGWQQQGAQWLHVVDLDGAFCGSPQNLDMIRRIVLAVDLPVQLGGGIRTEAAVRQVLALGIARVVLGTVAIVQPELVQYLCQQYGERIVVGIDSRDGKVAVEGWEATVEKTAVELAREMRALGVQRVVYTDTRRDGMLGGPNLEATREVARAAGVKIVASGGVGSLEHLRSLRQLEADGVEGIILGRSLYAGAFTLEEALAVARGVDLAC